MLPFEAQGLGYHKGPNNYQNYFEGILFSGFLVIPIE